MSNGSKKCSKCGQVKELDQFHRNGGAKDGLQARCKACRSEVARLAYLANPQREARATRSREWRRANPDRAKATDRRWREANREKRKAAWRAWADRNREKLRARDRNRSRKPDPEARRRTSREWRRRNPEAVREQTRNWRRRNKQRARDQVQRRRALQSAAQTFHLTERDLRHLADAVCLGCGSHADSVDHITPLSRGGSHGVGNLAPMCRTCNSSKGAKTITEWRKANDWLPLGSFPRRKDRADGAA